MAESKEKTTNLYEFLLTRATPESSKDIPHITDFHYVAFVRDPILRQSTFIDISAMVPANTLAVIESEISNKKFPEYELTCYQIKEIDKSTEDGTNRQMKIYASFVTIVRTERLTESLSTNREVAEGSVPVRMLLTNSIAWQMSVNTSFNKIFAPSPKEEPLNPILIALETIINNDFNPQKDQPSKLTSFTDYIINKYAGDNKNIKQIILADKNQVNLSPYEQILVPPTIPEINVPEYIISTYKPFHTPSFWFFDTFNFADYDGVKSENGKIPIWCILINFYNCQEIFKTSQYDITKDSNISVFTHLLGSVPFVDSSSVLARPNAMVNFIRSNMTQQIEKLGDIPGVRMADNTTEKQAARVTSLKVYHTDSFDSAKKRISDCMQLFSEIDRIEYYETTNTSPEWLQFGKLYNLETDAETGINTYKYIHTPICIVNIFKRRQTKDDTMECINKYAMLRLAESSQK